MSEAKEMNRTWIDDLCDRCEKAKSIHVCKYVYDWNGDMISHTDNTYFNIERHNQLGETILEFFNDSETGGMCAMTLRLDYGKNADWDFQEDYISPGRGRYRIKRGPEVVIIDLP